MVEQGFGYVCRCTADAFKEFRISKTNCPCRSQNVQDNLVLWKRMLDGKFKPGEAVVWGQNGHVPEEPGLEGLACPPYSGHNSAPAPATGGRLLRTWSGRCLIFKAPLKTTSKASSASSVEKTSGLHEEADLAVRTLWLDVPRNDVLGTS